MRNAYDVVQLHTVRQHGLRRQHTAMSASMINRIRFERDMAVSAVSPVSSWCTFVFAVVRR